MICPGIHAHADRFLSNVGRFKTIHENTSCCVAELRNISVLNLIKVVNWGCKHPNNHVQSKNYSVYVLTSNGITEDLNQEKQEFRKHDNNQNCEL